MVRNYVKKRNRPEVPEETIQTAVSNVIQNNMSIRLAASTFGVKKSTLHDRVSKAKRQIAHSDSGNDSDEGSLQISGLSKYATRQIFSVNEENELESYLKQSSQILYGLTYQATRKLAYQYAVKLQKTFPIQWKENEIAGVEWMRLFMKRHPRLSLRKPENTSVARASAFNKHNVDEFFNNYIQVQDKYKFDPSRIWNTDETGISTVIQAPKVIAETGKRVVGQCVSGERGTLVTFCGVVSATGNTIPPMYIYPRIRMKNHFLNGSVPGAIGYGSKSGWMTAELFVKLLEHIKIQTQSSKMHPILLLMDNHETHVSVEAINYSRENGIVLVSFPPHCTHKMQPLDKTVYGPFKQKCKVSFNDHISSNPGRPVTIYDIAKLTSEPYLQSFTPKNIISGFSSTGLWPINRLIFSEEDFFGAYATDRTNPQPERNEDSEKLVTIVDPSVKSVDQDVNHVDLSPSEKDNFHINQASISLSANNLSTNSENKFTHDVTAMMRSIVNEIVKEATKPLINIVSLHILKPSDIKPFPKAAPRKTNRKSRVGKSRIYTSTPEKTRIEELEEIRKLKLDKSGTKKKLVINKTSIQTLKSRKPTITQNIQKKGNKNNTRKRTKIPKESDTSSDSNSESFKFMTKKNKFLDSSSDSDIDMTESDCDEFSKLLDDEEILCDDYVLVQFPTKKTVIHYVGQVIQLAENGEFVIKYLRNTHNRFHFPTVDDISTITRSEIVGKLPRPTSVTGNARLSSFLKFNVNFSSLNVK
ncbi:hypothetical protein PPYR_02256 [Photinus pyralis]|uniref:HTH CENPB-type domain-containing protein n=1 Tax=Photinus pyralis TaxID=7054 RepID=A0A5N4B6U1_PHOPY|nr:uncharacterized protein LOC116159881 [Photinus pyralis]KAB0805286.1 hypothetical protein PPYR_02256 [Photinus pyralis]